MPHADRQMRPTLIRVKEWAQSKIRAGAEPPWAWYQYMKLIEAAMPFSMGWTPLHPRGIYGDWRHIGKPITNERIPLLG
jgi:hypothetical protein